MIPCVRKYGIGCEQGAESIHAHMNRLNQQFNGLPNSLDRLKYGCVQQTNVLMKTVSEQDITVNSPDISGSVAYLASQEPICSCCKWIFSKRIFFE